MKRIVGWRGSPVHRDSARWARRCVALGLAVALGMGRAAATERHVPSPYGTIQAAIDAAVNGDVVIVADGVYSGPGNQNVMLLGKSIVVRSANGPQNCIIDCGHAGSGFRPNQVEPPSTVIDGFTVRNAADSGMMCGSTSLTIANCILTGNAASVGGGLALSGSGGGVVEDCTITSNVATYYGGGVYVGAAAGWIIRRCTIQQNQTESPEPWGGMGGGVCLESGGINYLVECVVTANAANWGGGLAGSGRVFNCTISGNTAAYGGGGECYS